MSLCHVIIGNLYYESVGNKNISKKTFEKPSTIGVKNLLNAFDEAGEEPLEHMPDYEQFISGNVFGLTYFCNGLGKPGNYYLLLFQIFCR